MPAAAYRGIMDKEQDNETAALLARLHAITAAIQAETAIVEERTAELRRQHRAAPYRRSGPGSVDAQKYALGGVLALLGVAAIEEPRLDIKLLGLLAHPIQMMRWIMRMIENGAPPRLDALIVAIFSDPNRARWCEQWGRILQWRYRAPLYQAAVVSFLESGRTGAGEPWRRKEMTEDQASLVLTLVDLLGGPSPALATRGEAFDWIHAYGGNPAYWVEPPSPEWEADHD